MRGMRISGVVLATLLVAACGHFTPANWPRGGDNGNLDDGVSAAELGARAAAERAERRARERANGPASPAVVEPANAEARGVWRQALRANGRRIVISVDQRWLWLMDGAEVVYGAPVAVGTSKPFSYAGKKYDFRTPRARWQVLGKETDPLWVPPNWHYYEIAVERDLEPVHLEKAQRFPLEDGTVIEVRGDDVGRVNQYGNFWPFRPGTEIIFEGKIFIPPIGTNQRKVPEVLGTHRLIMGDGYLIHGTNEEDSVGEAVSHGCVRMYNEDVAVLYGRVPVGTPVYIY